MTEPVEVIHANALGQIPHGFLGRRGGVSQGIHAGLNVGWGWDDEREAVTENRARATNAVLPGAALVTVHQIHSAEVVTITAPWPDDRRPQADALVTNRPGLLLGILTADCAPVLLADLEAGVIGAAHAGWKGALAGVTDATIAAMEALGARRERMAAAVGPCIAQASYEVDDAFAARFGPDNARFFREHRPEPTHSPTQNPLMSSEVETPNTNVSRLRSTRAKGGEEVLKSRPGYAWFDLEGYVAARLTAAGIATVEKLGLDTYADEPRFYSYRRATHRGEADYGRQISMIGL